MRSGVQGQSESHREFMLMGFLTPVKETKKKIHQQTKPRIEKETYGGINTNFI